MRSRARACVCACVRMCVCVCARARRAPLEDSGEWKEVKKKKKKKTVRGKLAVEVKAYVSCKDCKERGGRVGEREREREGGGGEIGQVTPSGRGIGMSTADAEAVAANTAGQHLTLSLRNQATCVDQQTVPWDRLT